MTTEYKIGRSLESRILPFSMTQDEKNQTQTWTVQLFRNSNMNFIKLVLGGLSYNFVNSCELIQVNRCTESSCHTLLKEPGFLSVLCRSPALMNLAKDSQPYMCLSLDYFLDISGSNNYKIIHEATTESNFLEFVFVTSLPETYPHPKLEMITTCLIG
jgi:hypothetical protein